MRELVLATRNRGKAVEVAVRLPGVRVLTLADVPEVPEVEETAGTFYGNALLKARAVWEVLRRPVLADDSGLCVRALGGRPGVLSARYAGVGATQEELVAKLLREMRGKEDRAAWFRTVMVYIGRDGRPVSASGTVRGWITEAPRGSGGFGYDPVFYYRPLRRTFAELSTEEKNRVSHRARALERLMRKVRLGG